MKQLIPFLLLLILQACKGKPDDRKVDLVSNGTVIAYTDCGKETDTTLLFVHGWCINRGYWQPQLDFFCSRYRVVAIDLPGFGESGKNRTRWNFTNYTDDIKNCIDQLKLKHVILVGHSMSGDILLDMSNRYPGSIAGIVGIDNLHQPGQAFTPEQQKELDAFFSSMEQQFDSTASQQMRSGLFHPTTDSTVVNRVMKDIFNSDSAIAIEVLKKMYDIAVTEKTMMSKLGHKLYLLNSDMYPISRAALEESCAKGFHAEIVPATGHYPMIEKPELFNAALQRILHAISREKPQ